ncbi:TVP38/TMEM64 family protein [Bradyrhizobium sp.]|uniref:TVP38/TMEM64 family protein n=1 Tax=Bradyrhizobium sp. TaxID=376 RepID=UPI0025C4BE5B|nr:TVP38/TMEM64 family protein [Bradyrhizobium sp.]
MKEPPSTLIKILGGGLLVLLLVSAGFVLPIRDWVQSFMDWVQKLGPIGVVAFAVAYVVAVVLILPSWVLTVSAGVAFGLWGIPLVVVSATLGAALAFLIARSAVRERIRMWAQKKPLLQALDKATSVEGWKVVGLLRLSPAVPFNLQNYAFGATDIPFWHFVIATFFGIMPGTSLYVYIGTLGRAAATSENLKISQIVLFSMGLLATVAVIAVITRKARQTLSHIGVKP